ncbi:MAG: lytic transglycosylase domain-containing protein [Bacteriovorax sp.]|nr:lytic transglycosylase domain-containing protein [Bacteriovorax sp.]
MKFVSGLCLTIILGCIWYFAGVISTNRLKTLELAGVVPYGPLPAVESTSYSYEGLHQAFDSTVPLKRASEFTKAEFKTMLLAPLSTKEQIELKPYLNSILDFSVEYQVDPFWITSIVMVESNFNLTALSSKNARGLMQIKPDTAQHLYQLMQKTLTDDQVSENLYHPKENIEVGVFYLKKLLQNFRMNYRFATVAYNIGPGKLRNRLVEKSLDVNNFSYLVKVRDRYVRLTQNFAQVTKFKALPYEAAYVYSEQGLKFELKIIDLFPTTSGSENLTAKF